MVEIVKGSEKYTEGFKMKAVNPDGVIFRFLPNITKIEKRMAFINETVETILHPPKRKRRKVAIAGAAAQKKTVIRDALLIYMDGTMMMHVSSKKEGEGDEEELDNG